MGCFIDVLCLSAGRTVAVGSTVGVAVCLACGLPKGPGRQKVAQTFSQGKPFAGLVRSGPFARGVMCRRCAFFLCGWDFL